jgi:hypothetical protein
MESNAQTGVQRVGYRRGDEFETPSRHHARPLTPDNPYHHLLIRHIARAGPSYQEQSVTHERITFSYLSFSQAL